VAVQPLQQPAGGPAARPSWAPGHGPAGAGWPSAHRPTAAGSRRVAESPRRRRCARRHRRVSGQPPAWHPPAARPCRPPSPGRARR
jgi:hypothetical protein